MSDQVPGVLGNLDPERVSDAGAPRVGHNHWRTDGGPEPVGEQHDRMYPNCPTREADRGCAVAGQEVASSEARLLASPGPYPNLTVEEVAGAMQIAWDEFCADTGCFPDCFELRGRTLYANFGIGNFARHVTAWLTAESLESVRADPSKSVLASDDSERPRGANL